MSDYANRSHSDSHPLRYADQSLVQKGDYVLCFNREGGRVVGISHARVWDTCYHEDGTPIGTVLVEAAHPCDAEPQWKVFELPDNEGGTRVYRRGERTYSQAETASLLRPLCRTGKYLRTWDDKNKHVFMKPLCGSTPYPEPECFDDAFFYNLVVAQAQEGNPACLFTVGFWQREQEKFAEAVRCFKAAAEYNEADAWLELGLAYSEGVIVEADAGKAAACFLRAAEQGSLLGQYRFALCCIGGEGVSESDAKALRWLQAAAEGGFPPACLDLGRYYSSGSFNQMRPRSHRYRRNNPIYEPLPHLAAEMFAKAAAAEWEHAPLAKYHLAECFRLGLGLPEDSEQATELYCEAVRGGDLSQEEIQSAVYHTGNTVLLGALADSGSVYAAYLFGRMHWYGENRAPKDRMMAKRYLRQAAESGHECAVQAIQILQEKEDNTWAFIKRN